MTRTRAGTAATPPSSDPNKIIIIDWDDTLLPSSYVDRVQTKQFRDMPLHHQNLMNELGRCVDAFLREASRHGEVIIITNSDEGWVRYSAERYAPALVPVMDRYRVVSARTRYERFYPGQPLCWKAAAFAHEVNELYERMDEATNKTSATPDEDDDDHDEEENDVLNASCVSADSTEDDSADTLEDQDQDQEQDDDIIMVDAAAVASPNRSATTAAAARKADPPGAAPGSAPRHAKREIISFGDSLEERTAVRIVAGQLDAMSKSVMFLANPTPMQLIGQMHMLTSHMGYVCDNPKTLDLEIGKDQAKRCAESYMAENRIDWEEHFSNARHATRPAIVADLS